MPPGCVFHAIAAPYTPDNARLNGPKKPSDLTVIAKKFHDPLGIYRQVFTRKEVGTKAYKRHSSRIFFASLTKAEKPIINLFTPRSVNFQRVKMLAITHNRN